MEVCLCEWVPITDCGRTVYVAEHKKEVILKYINIFPEVRKVFCLGLHWRVDAVRIQM